jgi:hypothetical protein
MSQPNQTNALIMVCAATAAMGVFHWLLRKPKVVKAHWEEK